jgi:rhodanese-related sulfurtransferase
MNTREKLSAFLLITAVILALIKLPGESSLKMSLSKVLSEAADRGTYLTPDQVARYIVNEDSTVMLIDVRSSDEYEKINIPGSINLPYNDFLKKDLFARLPAENIKKIFYSNDDYDSNFAFILAEGLGSKNNFVMTGGFNGWFTDIMNSEFRGERITARENALFETRYKARKLFTEINSLPDSLKAKRLILSRFDPKKLDGGCE